MGNFKMICLDIDGTLLNSEHKITKRTKEIINLLSKEKNIPVILVSARMPKGILPFHEELNIIEPIICYSGSLIIDEKREIIFNREVDTKDLEKIYNIIKKENIHMSLYKDNEWFVESLDEWAKQESEIIKLDPTIRDFRKLMNMWENEDGGANKLLCMSEPVSIEKLNKRLEEENLKNLNIYPSKPTYLEIMTKKASKTSAIEFLCKKFNVKQQEIVSIGDNYNDIDMLEYAGLGIAMGNSPERVKKSADEVTLTNDEEGVDKALEKIFL